MSGAAPRFRVQSPGGRLTMQTLAAGETAIGRDARAGLVLDDARISRRHALLVRDEARVMLTDLASRNGTFLNGRRLGAAPEVLAPGDVVKVGDFTLVFEPAESIPFTEEPAVEMRQVLQKAPDEMIRSSMAVPAASRDVSARACVSSSTRRRASSGCSTN